MNKPQHRLAVIGGTGVYDPRMLTELRQHTLATPFGAVSYLLGCLGPQEVVFLARHGSGHSIPPHLINYRANIYALKKLGVASIIATTAVGSLRQHLRPGDFVAVDQFLDFTKGRTGTFFDGGSRGVVHVDVTEPYCPSLRQVLGEAATTSGVTLHTGGCYVCAEGPRFETPAEIRMFASLGGDVVGMTNIPEAVLAREAEMCYATVSMVTNYAAGISPHKLTHGEVLDIMQENSEKLRALLMEALRRIPAAADCGCRQALQEYGGFDLTRFEEGNAL